jgi:hypothetical protein
MIASGDRGRKVKRGSHELFPLPFVPVPQQIAPLPKQGALSRKQFRRHYSYLHMTLLVNLTIWSLNQMASKSITSAVGTADAVSASVPCIPTGFRAAVLYFSDTVIYTDWASRTRSQSSALAHLWQSVSDVHSSFTASKVLSSGSCYPTACDSLLSTDLASSLFNSFIQQLSGNSACPNPTVPPVAADSSLPSSFPPSDSSFFAATDFTYGLPAKMVPIVSSRVALPDTALEQVEMMSLLPENVRSVYADPSRLLLTASDRRDRQLRSTPQYAFTPRRAYVNGERHEYLALVRRLFALAMLSLTLTPKAVNSIFAVVKDTDSDRLIIDAQEGNTYFVDSPMVKLPNPSHLAALQLPPGYRLVVGKSDLSNYYHHIRIPEWVSAYLCLPPVSYAELGLEAPVGVNPFEACVYPSCTTLPMGWSHSVYIAQVIHEHVLYSSCVLDKRHNLLNLAQPLLTAVPVVHAVYIDDLTIVTAVPMGEAVPSHVLTLFTSILQCYARRGLVVKPSKVVWPTFDAVTVLGVQLYGHTLSFASDKVFPLLRETLSLLTAATVSGDVLSRLLGSWCWILLLNRYALSTLRHVWRYAAIAAERPYTLWPSVRKELILLTGVLPLLKVDLSLGWHEQVIATDASEDGAGMVATPDPTAAFLHRVWPLCHRKQQYVDAETSIPWCNPMLKLPARARLSHARFKAKYHLLQPALHRLQALPNPISFDKLLKRRRWRVIVSHAWRYRNCARDGEVKKGSHINHLETTSLLLAMRWLSSRRDGMNCRVVACLDSSVLFFGLWKGRSSSSLHAKVSSIAAHCLALNVKLLPVWLPSAWNPADRPSRTCHNRQLQDAAQPP